MRRVAPRCAAGSSIETAIYHSAVLHRRGPFLTYLPPGYASTDAALSGGVHVDRHGLSASRRKHASQTR